MTARGLPRVLATLAVAVVAYALAVAGRAERLTGGVPTLRYQVTVPYDVLVDTDTGMGAIERIWRQRLRAYHLEVGPGQHGSDGVVVGVDVTGAPAAEAEAIARALDARGAMAMRMVASDTPEARRLMSGFGDRHQPARPDGVRAEPDSWVAERALHDRERMDYYLAGPTRAAIAAAIAELEPPLVVPDELELMYEDVPAPPEGGRPYVRTYFVERATIVTQADVDSAVVSYDPYTRRPEVLLSFTREGAVAFGEATAAGIGRKLAIVVDDRVVSAPIIQGAIRGGRSTITMGGDDPRRQEAAAAGLAAALRGGRAAEPLPAGIHARLIAAEDGASGRTLTLLAIAVLAGLGAWFAPLGLRRLGLAPIAFGAPSVVRPPLALGRGALALAVTIGVPLFLILAADELPLPGLTDDVFAVMDRGGGSLRSISVFALGVMPLVGGFWLAELFALGIPRWRSARLGTPAERRPIDRLALALTFALAAVQAFALMRFFDQTGGGALQLIAPGFWSHAALCLSLVAGVMVQVVAARIITRFGLASGVLVLFATGAALTLWKLHPTGDPDARRLVLAVAAAIALAAALASTWGSRGGRQPWTGVVPVAAMPIAIALLSMPALAWELAGHWLAKVYGRPPSLDTVVALILTVGLVGRRRDRTPGALALAVGFVVLLLVLPRVLAAPIRPLVDVTLVVAIGVTVLELGAGLRARLRLHAPTTVAVVHDVDRADALGDALAAAGIDHARLGVHARAALRLLGSFCPIRIQVAAADADRARACLDDG